MCILLIITYLWRFENGTVARHPSHLWLLFELGLLNISFILFCLTLFVDLDLSVCVDIFWICVCVDLWSGYG
jgi:hypothetical protein